MAMTLPDSWSPVLKEEIEKPYFSALMDYVAAERAAHKIFPPEDEVFAALEATPYDQVRVLLLGQDPYFNEGQAHGMCFSVRPGNRIPPSLVNVFREMRADIGCEAPKSGYLMPWAEQGVLLLNSVLTVRAGEPNSHKGKGWEKFTDAVIKAVNDRPTPVVFVLWGAQARKKVPLIDRSRHTIVEGAHPSPQSVSLFLGSRPFSAVNTALVASGQQPIDWAAVVDQ